MPDTQESVPQSYENSEMYVVSGLELNWCQTFSILYQCAQTEHCLWKALIAASDTNWIILKVLVNKINIIITQKTSINTALVQVKQS